MLGIIGAIVGGFVWGLLTGDGFDACFNIGGLMAAIVSGLNVSCRGRLVNR